MHAVYGTACARPLSAKADGTPRRFGGKKEVVYEQENKAQKASWFWGSRENCFYPSRSHVLKKHGETPSTNAHGGAGAGTTNSYVGSLRGTQAFQNRQEAE